MTFRTTVMMENGQVDELLRVMSNTQNMLKIFKAYKIIQLRSGKTDDSPEIIYIDKKIREFENDFQILRVKCQL